MTCSLVIQQKKLDSIVCCPLQNSVFAHALTPASPEIRSPGTMQRRFVDQVRKASMSPQTPEDGWGASPAPWIFDRSNLLEALSSPLENCRDVSPILLDTEASTPVEVSFGSKKFLGRTLFLNSASPASPGAVSFDDDFTPAQTSKNGTDQTRWLSPSKSPSPCREISGWHLQGATQKRSQTQPRVRNTQQAAEGGSVLHMRTANTPGNCVKPVQHSASCSIGNVKTTFCIGLKENEVPSNFTCDEQATHKVGRTWSGRELPMSPRQAKQLALPQSNTAVPNALPRTPTAFMMPRGVALSPGNVRPRSPGLGDSRFKRARSNAVFCTQGGGV